MTTPQLAIILLALLLVGLVIGIILSHRQEATAAPQPGNDVVVRVAALEIAVRGLPSLWETERQRVTEQAERTERAAARVEQAARRAEKRGKDSELEPERSVVESVRIANGDGGGEAFLPAVRTNVAKASGRPSPFAPSLGIGRQR